MMVDQLLEISPRDWKEWRDLYKTDWPRHEVSYNLIQNYIDWMGHGVDLKEVVAYSLNGEWAKDGTYILIDRSEMFMYSLDSTLARLRRLLMLVDWTRSYLVNMGLYRSLVIEIYQMFNLDIVFDKHTFIYYVPHEDARKLDVVLPAGFKFAPLEPVDAVFINSEWPHKYPGSEAFVERLIRRNVNLGLFDASGKLMAWCMRVQHGAMGMLGVAYPRRGYGSIMALGFARKLGELGHNCYASVIAPNEPSRRMFDKLGFQVKWTTDWLRNGPRNTFSSAQ
uniref:GCN5-related N-acetyltransferase Rv2170-like domain-containing protein n=1 Tax=Anopheles atroparvus TaxID=41427 RepID=A0AAG5DG92_ANOAO